MTESVLERAKRLMNEQGYQPTFASAPEPYDPDLIPDVGDTREPDEITPILDGLDILEAYARWCGKMEPKVGSKRESIMISCPKPNHPDANPSAWINTNKQVYHCASCDEGGDKYTIAGYHFGLDPHRDFPVLRQAMAEDLGYVIRRTLGGNMVLSGGPVPAPAPMPPPTAEPEPPTPPPAATVTQLRVVPDPEPEPDPDDEQPDVPAIDWREIVPQGTFLDRWMRACSVDDLPEEYYFWLGLIAIGFAAGDKVILTDVPAVKPNLFVCLVGPTGIGKSRSISALTRLLKAALPYDHGDPLSTGTSLISTPASAEVLVDAFSKRDIDPITQQPTTYCKIRGLVKFDELASLTGRASRVGNPIKPTLMELYDGYDSVETRSRGTGYVKAEHPFCQALTTTQMSSIHRLVTRGDADSGFLNRFVFGVGVPKALIPIRKTSIDIDPLKNSLQAIRGWASSGRSIELEGAAGDLWSSFFSEKIEPLKVDEEHPLHVRLDLTLKKLIILFCLNEQRESPSVGLVARVLSLFPHLTAAYELIAGKVMDNDMEVLRKFLIPRIQSHFERTGLWPTLREIKKQIARTCPAEELTKVMKVMVEVGDLEESVTPSKRGPSTVRYSCVA